MLLVGVVTWGLYRKSRLPQFMIGEAVCLGAFLSESVSSALRLFHW